ncbi:hypothetical protein HAT2_00493 [Candidatus Similichlamydia laticola]|uniref:Uncharacterized protein n=1 Tax=Candidatus Similichlamydia laticola TaxID=2170265 RepID=A0A369KCS8_9BACT|nr:hypothetical protein HAT2_00493 [Candidatus Similichlamydia laticola]
MQGIFSLLFADLEVVTVHFTREPIVETVITAREGAKLLVRSARRSDGVDTYLVEAVEVVMFGGAVFYRSASRPSPFLVPVGEYEVVECSSGRVHLKKPIEKSARQGHRDSVLTQDSVSAGVQQASLVEKGQLPQPFPSVGTGRAVASEQSSSHPSPVPSKAKRGKTSGSARGDSRLRRLAAPPPFPEELPVSGDKRDNASQGNEDVVDRASKILASLIPPPPVLVSDSLGSGQNKGASTTSSESVGGGRRSSFGKRGGGRFDRERRGGREAD